MLFGELGCRAVFTLKSDNVKCHRVCGCRATDCTCEGHTALRLSVQGRGLEGTYKPIKARKYDDGKLRTFLPKEDYFAKVVAVQQERQANVSIAARILKGSPTSSDEAAYSQSREWEDAATMDVPTSALTTRSRLQYPSYPGSA